jgi:ferredoxin
MKAWRPISERDQRLVVDWDRCVGHGVCAAAYGENVTLDQWGYPLGVSARGVEVPPEHLRAARLAVSHCPAMALRLQR